MIVQCIPPFAELETKRILLDIFKEKQKKSAEAGTIPSFYKKAREIKHHRFIIFFFLVYFMHALLALSTLITFLYFGTDSGLMKTSLCFIFLRMDTFTVAFAFFLTVFPFEYVCYSHKSNNMRIDLFMERVQNDKITVIYQCPDVQNRQNTPSCVVLNPFMGHFVYHYRLYRMVCGFLNFRFGFLWHSCDPNIDMLSSLFRNPKMDQSVIESRDQQNIGF